MITKPVFKLLFVPAFILALAQLSPLPASAQAAHWKFDEIGSPTVLDFVGTNLMALQDTATQSNASPPAIMR